MLAILEALGRNQSPVTRHNELAGQEPGVVHHRPSSFAPRLVEAVACLRFAAQVLIRRVEEDLDRRSLEQPKGPIGRFVGVAEQREAIG